MIDFVVNAWSNIVATFWAHPVAQGLGYIAFGFSVYNFLFCKDRRFIIVTAIVSGIWGCHFLLLGLAGKTLATIAGCINIFDIFKNIISLHYKKNIYRVMGLTAIYVIIQSIIIYYEVGGYQYTGIIDLIPTIAAIVSTYLVFYVRGVWLNVGFLGIVMIYMIYNYSLGSQGGLMTDVFLFFFGIVGIVRQMREQ